MREITECIRAKSKDDENFLLQDHLKETVKRVVSLKEFIEKNRGVIDYQKFDEKFFKNLLIASFLHDLGKINWTFQLEVFGKDEGYKSEDWQAISEFFKDVKDAKIKDHEVVSILYSLIFLENGEDAKKIRSAILLHHYNQFYVNKEMYMTTILEEYPDLKKYIDFLIAKENEIKSILAKIIDHIINTEPKLKNDTQVVDTFNNLKSWISFDRIKELNKSIKEGYGISTKIQMFNIPDKEDETFYDFFVFLGCLRRCDYSASGHVMIESAKNLADEVYIDLNNHIKEKIKDKIQPTKELWQEKILAENNEKNLVLIAPTGSGKTEFALLWAKNIGKKLIYTLPLRVALNDLYERFGSQNSQNKGYFYSTDNNILRILHSTAFIEYIREEKNDKQLDIDEKQTTAQLFSSPIVLTTPDQVFLSSLKYYGFDKILSIYPLSSIVIDEIQAYNPEMAAVIIKTMEIIQQLGGNILVITATFPPYFKEFITGQNNEVKIKLKVIDLKEYQNKSDVKNYTRKRHKIDVIVKNLFEVKDKENKNEKSEENTEKSLEKEVDNKKLYTITDEAKKKVKELIKEHKNKNILIIVNNVEKAIELFKLLEHDDDIKERVKINYEYEDLPLLLHARLIEKEKSRRIEAVKEAVKKEISNKKNGMVLVSTQIVEASVDIDFDMLITEISPIDSQIQRWGRIYRNRENDYNENAPNIYIFSGVDKGTIAIYDKDVIDKTVEELNKKINDILNYEDERDLIENVFKEKINGKTLKEVYINKINENLEWLKYYSTEKRGEAQHVFRRISSVQVVLPTLMKNSKDPIEKKLGEFLLDNINNIKDLSWKEIIEKISNPTGEKIDFWHILKIIYEYSCSVPFYHLEGKILNESLFFKGFFIKIVKDKDADIEKYGNILLDTLNDLNLSIDESILN